MADLGRALISKIIVEDDIVTAMTAGIKSEWFEDTEHQKVYRWMLDYFNRYGETPTPDTLDTQFPNYRLLRTVPEPYDYYIDQFRNLRKRSVLVDTIIDADGQLKEDDPKAAQESLSRGLQRLGKEVTSLTDENAVGRLRTRFDLYEEARQNIGKITGIETGFPTLDYVSGGWHPQDFILFGGAPKQCKSFMLMKSAIAAQACGNKVLFVSFEMSRFQQLCRYDALCCSINSAKLLHGTLSDEDMKKLKQGFRLLKNLEPFIISADISATTTVSGLAGKIEQHQPDVVFIDGVYLMENEVGAEQGTPMAYTSISRGLKRLSQRIEKPVVATTQSLPGKMSKGVVTLHSLGWTSAWAQDADLILGVERDPNALHLLNLRVVGGRNVSPREITIACNWEESIFDESEPIGIDDDD